jgi:cyclase
MTASAQEAVALDVQELAPRVWRVKERRHGPSAVAGVIAVGRRTVVFDTLESHAAGARLRQLAQAVAPISLVVNSHWHPDHVSGNAAFADLPIAASAATRAEVAEARPSVTLEGTLVAHDRNRAVEILAVGPAHTHGDVVAFVRDCGVLFAGDLVVDTIHPRLRHGDPHAWLAVLERLEALRPSCVVRGHGPPGGRESLAQVRAYIERMLRGGDEPLPGCTDLHVHAANHAFALSLAQARRNG